MARVLISGAGGFLGRHLTRTLERAHDVVAVDLCAAPTDTEPTWVQLTEPAALAATIEAHAPEFMVHAAFVNRRPPDQTVRAYQDDMLATNLPLFEAAARTKTRLLLVSSSAVYGAAGGRDVIDESCPRDPVSVYGVAKTTQELFAAQAAATVGLQLAVLRLFNLCGPGQRAGMLLPDWVTQAVAISRGAEPLLKVFNLATDRDFVDVRDAAAAAACLIDDFRPGAVLNVASGRSMPLRTIVDRLAELCPRRFEVEQLRPEPDATDVLRQRGSFARLHDGWGWSPQRPFEQSLADLWEEWSS